MVSLLRSSASVWRCGGRAWMGTASVMEDAAVRSREGGSCTVPLVFTKFDAKEEGEEKKEGGRPPVVLLHGLLGSQMMYRSLVKRKDFAPKRQVYTVDMRNHGQSPHVSEMDLHSLSRDVTKFMDTEGLEKACLVGHSIGGKVAMIMALEQQERVSELVVVDVAPVDSEKRMEEVTTAVNAMHDVDIENYRQKKDISDALEEHGVKDERVRQLLMTNVISDESDIGFYKWKLHIQAIQEALPQLRSFPTFEDGRVYNGPTLFTYGESSSFVSKGDEVVVKKLFPHAEMLQISGAGHWLQTEKPEEFCKALNGFLKDDNP